MPADASPGSSPTARPWAHLPLTGALDRAAELRAGPGALASALADDSTRVVMVHRGRLAVSAPSEHDPEGAGDRPERPEHPDRPEHPEPPSGLDLAPVTAVRDLAPASDTQPVARWLLLGRTAQGARVLALLVPDDADAHAPGIEGVSPRDPWAVLLRSRTWLGLRDAAPRLSSLGAALAVPAVALAAWHARSARCPGCGEPTTVTSAGWVRRCDAEGTDHFPRTDPAVIMAVVDDADRLLLGHAVAWPAGRFSTLAGYVEPGESLEAAVRREVLEETGVVVGEVEYRASQPWPFPASLMLGFRAWAVSTEVSADSDEVDDARWFTRDDLAAAVGSGQVLLPGEASIARALIEEWFGGPLAPPAAGDRA